MAESIHPLPVGAKVFHAGQMWAHNLVGGTAVIVEVAGPYRDGSYEYVVDVCREFSRRPGPDNPMDQRSQWASYMTRPARERSRIEDLLDRSLLIRDRVIPTDIVDRDRPGYGEVPGA
ncbi:hypothetical protein [Streptomyces sp. MH60]|uniref:hypothetical protein n=1 Tax=Streptomyces sp. MH60 TaxID=1940758 RepID=UPI000CEE32CB|nr:hypothetical protein [Streptomyces sp. MH60]PPS89423.1 hypothetical protein BZZ08_01569 [Streptomyces sp. MH60]